MARWEKKSSGEKEGAGLKSRGSHKNANPKKPLTIEHGRGAWEEGTKTVHLGWFGGWGFFVWFFGFCGVCVFKPFLKKKIGNQLTTREKGAGTRADGRFKPQ